MISNFLVLYPSNISFQSFLDKYNNFLDFHMTPAALLLKTSCFFILKLIISIALRALLKIHKTYS